MESRVLLTFAVCLLAGLCSSTEIPIEEHQEEELKLPETVHFQESQDENLGLGGYDDKLGGYDDKLPDHKHATSYQSFYLESKNPVPIVIKKEYYHEHKPTHHEHKPVHHEYSYGSHENLVPQHDNSQFDYHGYQHQ